MEMQKRSRDASSPYLLGPNAGRKRAERKKRRLEAEKNGGAANPPLLLIVQPDHLKQSASSDRPEASKTAAAPVGRLCRLCKAEEASVVVFSCRHLCLCRACECKTSVCPVCKGDKIYVIVLEDF